MASQAAKYPRGLYLIAAFKLFKGLVLFAVGIGALRLLNNGVAAEVYRWANAFRVDPNNQYLQRLLLRFSILDDKRLKELSVGTFFYSALFLCEGVGLALRKRWAEYLTIISTTSLMPIEILEIYKRPSAARVALLLVNLGVVAYLVRELRRMHGERLTGQVGPGTPNVR